ncbi:MAG: Flp family type IVb pilin [Actinobacteria bacterium]|jgi:Flp pilus assembly pilin Flp|nr:Flp family type IVb pilin [Actinomycetota bacterium]
MRHHLTVLRVATARWRRHLTVAVRTDRGASAVEYGLIGAMISVAILMVVVVLGF